MAILPEFLEHEMHRARVYRLLADAFSPPVPELSERLTELNMRLTKLESRGGDTAAGLFEGFAGPQDIETLKVDHARLFVGPFLLLAPPYGSVYLEGERRIMSESSMDARNHYLKLGLDLGETFKEAPDHVCAELEFMHVLLCKGMETIQMDDGDAWVDTLYRQHSFLGNHFGAWMPQFTDQIIEHAETKFYRTLGETTRRFIEEECAAMDLQAYNMILHDKKRLPC